jgi:hypothetical protein
MELYGFPIWIQERIVRDKEEFGGIETALAFCLFVYFVIGMLMRLSGLLS